jgi:outer membrane protein OmpA-like peptidoglycan-associated protein
VGISNLQVYGLVETRSRNDCSSDSATLEEFGIDKEVFLMKRKLMTAGLIACMAAITLIFTFPLVSAQEPTQNTVGQQVEKSNTMAVTAGQEAKLEGLISKRTQDGFVLSTGPGSNAQVVVTNQTQIKEKKSNPFRKSKNYGVDQLLRGLSVEVKGRGNSSGALVAQEIALRADDLTVAESIQTNVVPVENRLNDAEGRLSLSEQNARHLAGQVEELAAVSNAARGGAKAAQETADAALDTAKQAGTAAESANAGVRAANDRITSLDDYEVQNVATVQFKVSSTTLSDDAKVALDKLATEAKNAKGWVIEVTGFASSDGNEIFNRQLSQRRADAVVRYLLEQQGIPLRRIVTPFGFGEAQPVADNSTRTGREQNRRVEVRVLISKGLASQMPVTASANTSAQ